MTNAAFVKRLRLDSVAVFSTGCNLCFKDILQEWEHNVGVVVSPQRTFVRAATAPMLQRPESKLHVPPFPALVLTHGEWTGKVLLRHWRGHQSRLGAYGSENTTKVSDGTAHLEVGAPGKGGKPPPSKAQMNGFRYLLKHEKQIRDAILQAILAAYPAMQKKYGYSAKDARELMPEIKKATALK